MPLPEVIKGFPDQLQTYQEARVQDTDRADIHDGTKIVQDARHVGPVQSPKLSADPAGPVYETFSQ